MSFPECTPENLHSGERPCEDGLDNDFDGATDCDDHDCFVECSDPPLIESECCDGVDNDNDGLIDLNDADCASCTDPACCVHVEYNCMDGIDDDGEMD